MYYLLFQQSASVGVVFADVATLVGGVGRTARPDGRRKEDDLLVHCPSGPQEHARLQVRRRRDGVGGVGWGGSGGGGGRGGCGGGGGGDGGWWWW